MTTEDNGKVVGTVTPKTVAGVKTYVANNPPNDLWQSSYVWFRGHVQFIVSGDEAAPAPKLEAFIAQPIKRSA